MTLGKHIRLAGAVICIAAALTKILILSMIGLCIMAIGAMMQIDNLEIRLAALEPEEKTDDEA